MVSGSLDTSIRVWDAESGVLRHTLMGHQSLTSGMELKNNILVSAQDDKIADNRNSFYSDRYIEKGNYIRLDNTTLSYNFGGVAKGISNLRLYVSGNNLITITKYSGIDPEINQGGASPGIDYNNFFPKTRTVMFGLNLTF